MSRDDSQLDTRANAVPGVTETVAIEVASDGTVYRHLSRQAREELQAKLSEMSVVVLKEAESLERSERAAGAEPDISRSHIQEAWYNTRRRRRDTHQARTALLSSLYSLCLFLIGVGISNYKQFWGLLVVIIGSIAAAACLAVLVTSRVDS